MQRSFCSLLLVTGAAFGAPTDSNSSAQIINPQSSGNISTGKEQIATGFGLAYAESCQAKLFAWRSSKTSFGSQYGHTSTSIFSSELPLVSHDPTTPTATSVITLCDGYPRVVGQWTTHNASSYTYNYEWTNTNPVFVPASYPTPKPCSISPDDCKLLYSSWTSHWNAITLAHPNYGQGLLDPPCETSHSPERTYSTNAQGGHCDNCLIVGNQIRLLYWPVTIVAGSGDLCNKTAETVAATATGPPRSIITEGITITSPTVAVSIGGLSRVDKCGTTVDHTIIPVLPEDVSSVQGARALFMHRPFNFADLNYKCIEDQDVEFVTTGSRTDCYREVPANAYFTGYANAAGANWFMPGAFANRTIWPNYQPQVLPPATMSEAIRSLWGPDCYIHPDGIWDPPIALQQEASFPLPKYAPGAPTQYYTPHTDAPQPGGPTTPHGPEPTQPITPTAEAQHVSSAPTPTAANGHGDNQHNGGQASQAHNNGQGGESGNESHQSDDSHTNGAGQANTHSSGQNNQQASGNDNASNNGNHGSGHADGPNSGNDHSNNNENNDSGHWNGSNSGNELSSNHENNGSGDSTEPNSDHSSSNSNAEHSGEHGNGSGKQGEEQQSGAGVQTHGTTGSHDTHNDGDDSSDDQGVGSSHEVVFTTVITYTSRTDKGGETQTGDSEQGGQVYTTTRVSTRLVGDDGVAVSTPGSSENSGDGDGGSNGSTGRQSAAQTSPAGTTSSDSGSDTGSIAGSSDDDDEGVSSAITSAIGGGDRTDSPPSQVNIAMSITKRVGLRLSMLAAAISIFL